MWITFAGFWYYHDLLLARAGSSNKESELSFGQVLSLTTWLPVLVDLGYIYFKGPKDALTGKMAKPYCADIPETVDDDETEPADDTRKEVIAAVVTTRAGSLEVMDGFVQVSSRENGVSPDQSLLARNDMLRA